MEPNNLYASTANKVNLNSLQIKAALNSGLHLVFILLICIIAVGLLLSSRIKKEQLSELHE